jgi:hypothetical protein
LQQAVENFLGKSCSWSARSCPARDNRPLPEPGRPFRRVYLRAAQAYMLISMPTGTSTIFGVFQLIRVLPSSAGTTFVPGRKLGSPWTERKYARSKVALCALSPKQEVRSWTSLLPSWTNAADQGAKSTHAPRGFVQSPLERFLLRIRARLPKRHDGQGR